MKRQSVEIDIEDNKVHAQIAFLVDSSLFLQDIKHIREWFKIDPVFEYGDFNAWNLHLHNLAGFKIDEVREMDNLPKEEYNNSHQKRQEWLKTRKYESERLSELRAEFNRSVALTRETHRYPPIFDEVIKQAILFNKIGEFKTTQAVIYRSIKPSNPASKNELDSTLAILLTPSSTRKEVLEAFEECKKLRAEYERTNPLTIDLDSDVTSNIERDRMWFWKHHHEGKKYEKILDDWNNMCPKSKNHKEGESCQFCDLSDQNVIEQAVSRYKKRLQFIFKKTDI